MSERGTILVQCRHLGGYGGEENYVACMLDALDGYDTQVFVTKTLLDHGLLPRPRPNLRIRRYRPGRFLGHLAAHARRISLFIGFSADRFRGAWLVRRALDACAFPKVINPAGNDVRRVLHHFDHVAWEAGNAAQFGMADHPKNLLLHPPGLHPINLPADFPRVATADPFLLTVFNNYSSALKGTDRLYEVARESPLPIVWCTSRTPLPEGIPGKLMPVFASRNLLSMLMQGCTAYLSLSASEGFGWSVFEAMTHGRPIISRPVGVAGDFASRIITYGNVPDLIRILRAGDFPARVDYGLGDFSPERFRRAIESLMVARPAR